MNKIILENYPVERLPDEIRGAFRDANAVKLTVEAEAPLGVPMNDVVAALRSDLARRDVGVSAGDAARQIRSIRDEWDQ